MKPRFLIFHRSSRNLTHVSEIKPYRAFAMAAIPENATVQEAIDYLDKENPEGYILETDIAP